MAQGGNSDGNKSLNDRKERAAGRQDEVKGPLQGNSDDFDTTKPGAGQVGGAFGDGKPDRGSALSKGGGGGGASPGSTPKD